MRDHYLTGLSERLQSGSDVRCLTHNALFLRSAFSDEIADDYQPCGYADPHLWCGIMPSNMKRRNSLDQCHASAHSPLCVILMCSRVAKVREHPIAHILRDKSTGLGDLLCAAAVIRADDLAQVLGIEPSRERGRTHKVAEHDRELA